MLQLKQGVALVAVGSLAFVAGRMLPVGDAVLAAQPAKDSKVIQPGKDKATPPAGAQPDLGAMPKPGAEHKTLTPLVGDFEGAVKMWSPESAEPMEAKAKIHREWDMDGWFVIERVNGDGFKGMGIVGYNTVDKRYETAWIDNSVSNISTSNGNYDAKTKVFTFTGEMIDPMTQKRVKTRTTVDVSSPEKEVMTTYTVGAGQKEYKSFEGTFARVKK